MEETYIREIRKEFKRIDKKWLKLHYKTAIGVVIFSFFVECCIGMLMYYTGEISSTIIVYLVKFLFVPCILNLCCLVITYSLIQSERISQEVKIYIVSLMFVIICFIIFTVHSAFTALYFIFAAPILLTMTYGSYRLTTVTYLVSLIGFIASELFIQWDVDKISIFNDGIRLGNFFISIFVLSAFYGICSIAIHFEKEKNAAVVQKELERYKLQQRLQIDELTGIYNRIGFRNAIQDMEDDRSKNTYIFAMIDIDNFKRLNDNFGHIIGDHCLIEFGKILKTHCTNSTPFRYGGDEFCILFQNCAMRDAVDTCKRIQESFQLVQINEKTDIPLTISVGIAGYSGNIPTSELIINTDKALYESKVKRNTITVYEETIGHLKQTIATV
jgi:diguanylate cyclase